MGPVFHSLGKDIAWVDNARDVKHGCGAVLVTLADVVFAEIQVLNRYPAMVVYMQPFLIEGSCNHI